MNLFNKIKQLFSRKPIAPRLPYVAQTKIHYGINPARALPIVEAIAAADIKANQRVYALPSNEIEERVIAEIRKRREKGRAKYGTSMERNDLSRMQWHQHLKEELLDAVIYLEKLIVLEEQTGKLPPSDSPPTK